MKEFISFFIIVLVITFSVDGKTYPYDYNFNKLEKEANKGDAVCQFWMGRTFEEGRLGKTPDIQKAFECIAHDIFK